MVIAGIDYSLTSPAICICEGPFAFANCSFHYLTSIARHTGKYLNGRITGKLHKLWSVPEQRYDNIAYWAMDTLNGAEFIVLEDYAFAAKGRVFHIAENTGLLKHQMWRFKKTVTTVAPTTIKKFATGKGNADKQMMIDAFINETKCNIMNLFAMVEPTSPASDVVDSYFMCKYADKLLKEEKK